MAKVKNFSKQVVTPKSVAIYPWLNSPDTRFGNAVYKVNLSFKGEEGQKFYEMIEATAQEALAHQKEIDPQFKKIKSLKLPIEPAEDEEGNEIEGEYVMKIKSNAFITVNGEQVEIKPKLVDANKKPFEGRVYGGSLIKCAINLVPYSGFGGGLTARLNAVQVLVPAEGGNSADAFDVEDDHASASDSSDDDTSGDDDF
jgi:hypothetical protein